METITRLIKTKTFWVGLLTIGAGVVEWVFEGDKQGAMDKILAGLVVITGRDALAKLIEAKK